MTYNFDEMKIKIDRSRFFNLYYYFWTFATTKDLLNQKN